VQKKGDLHGLLKVYYLIAVKSNCKYYSLNILIPVCIKLDAVHITALEYESIYAQTLVKLIYKTLGAHMVKTEQMRYVTHDNIYVRVDANDVLEVANQLGVNKKVMSALLGISLSTLNKKLRSTEDRKLNINVSERLLRLREVISVVVTYLGSNEGARHWLNTPNNGLENKCHC
jgi:putative toxin-antitoxin system antitoxin component (TIGR02293 family)